jgi:hypothetical protein
MKFHATVVFEFNASDVGEAGMRLNELLEQANERDLTTKSLELSTPHETPVSLPAGPVIGRPPGGASPPPGRPWLLHPLGCTAATNPPRRGGPSRLELVRSTDAGHVRSPRRTCGSTLAVDQEESDDGEGRGG